MQKGTGKKKGLFKDAEGRPLCLNTVLSDTFNPPRKASTAVEDHITFKLYFLQPAKAAVLEEDTCLTSSCSYFQILAAVFFLASQMPL